MDIRAKVKYLPISPKKVIPVVNLIRGKKTTEALEVLKFVPKKASRYLVKLINSAVANAKNNYKLDEQNLYISKIIVNCGPSLKRIKFRARGGRDVIKKRTSHIDVVISEVVEGAKVSPEKVSPAKVEEPKVSEKLAPQKPEKVTKKRKEIKKAEVKKKKKVSPEKPEKITKIAKKELPEPIKEKPKVTRVEIPKPKRKPKPKEEPKGFRKWIISSKKFFRRKGG